MKHNATHSKDGLRSSSKDHTLELTKTDTHGIMALCILNHIQHCECEL
jgi:hypothetical protein